MSENAASVEESVSLQDVLEEDQELESTANAVLGDSDDSKCSYSKVRPSSVTFALVNTYSHRGMWIAKPCMHVLHVSAGQVSLLGCAWPVPCIAMKVMTSTNCTQSDSSAVTVATASLETLNAP
jgi:hypothetical protein